MSVRNTVHAVYEVDLLSDVHNALCGKLLARQEDLPHIDIQLRDKVSTSLEDENWVALTDILRGDKSMDCGLCRRVVMTAVSEHRERVYVKRRKKEMAAEDRQADRPQRRG